MDLTRLVPVDNNTPSPLADSHIGLEARTQAGDHLDLKVWLRLLACSNQIEQQIRQRLRARFGTTLSRFDYLAQLERHPAGLRMNVLSRYLMVTGGNVTGLTDELVKEGLVERTDDPDDRRSWLVRLTAKGHADFAAMAGAHEGWVNEMFGGLADEPKTQLYSLLGQLRLSLSQRDGAATPATHGESPSGSKTAGKAGAPGSAKVARAPRKPSTPTRPASKASTS